MSAPLKPSGTLAIVDDDPLFVDFLTLRLTTNGHVPRAFHSGGALLDAIREGFSPQVVLLDVNMPGMNGIETLKAIKTARPSAHVIMLSGGRAPSTIVETVRLGAADYVLKPTDADGIGDAALDAAILRAFERESLTTELERLRTTMAEDPDGMQPYWATGSAMQTVMSMVERVADTDVSVLIRGESGVGKEVVARELHRRSPRRTKPFVKVNCAALPAELLESELFGHERGAFTGAAALRVGKFESAHTGTIMLDEIGEMPAALQAKLLHVLQDRQFTRLGSNKVVEVDVRIIAATNSDLESMMRARTFREDLYYRLQVIEITVPPLRDRRREIRPLSEYFLSKYSALYRRGGAQPSSPFMEALAAYDWPGNIRELENTIKRYVVLQDEAFIMKDLVRSATATPTDGASDAGPSSGQPLSPAASAVVEPPHPPPAADHAAATPRAPVPPVATGAPSGGESNGVDLQALAKAAASRAERDAIEAALGRFRWNRRKAAEYLNVSYKTLLNKIKETGIQELGPTD